jgi:hypothetical protein
MKRQGTAASFLIVVHRRLSNSFSKISPVVVVLERPNHGKYFAWVLGHELLGIVTEDKANHLIPSVLRHQFIGHALAFRAHQLVTNSRAEFVVHFGQGNGTSTSSRCSERLRMMSTDQRGIPYS